MIVDVRVRPPFGEFATLPIFGPPDGNPLTGPVFDQNAVGWDSRAARSFPTFVRELDEAGVQRAVVWGRKVAAGPTVPGGHFLPGSVSNATVSAVVETDPQRFVGFGGVDTSDVPAALEDIEDCRERGFRGVSLLSPFGDPAHHDDDPVLDPIYDLLAAYGLIAAVTVSGLIGPDLTYSDPLHVQRLALRHPNLTILVSHGGWPHVLGMIAVAVQCPNVHLCPDVYLGTPHMPGAGHFVDAANMGLWPRILFASAYPSRPVGQSLRTTAAHPWASPAIAAAVLGGNARRLLESAHG